MDIVFPEADRTSLADIQKTFKHDFGIDVSFDGVPAGLLRQRRLSWPGDGAGRCRRRAVFLLRPCHPRRSTRCARASASSAGSTCCRLTGRPGSSTASMRSPRRPASAASSTVVSMPTACCVRLPLLIEYRRRRPSKSRAGRHHAFARRRLRGGWSRVPTDCRSRSGRTGFRWTGQGYALLRFNGPSRTLCEPLRGRRARRPRPTGGSARQDRLHRLVGRRPARCASDRGGPGFFRFENPVRDGAEHPR